LKDRLQCPPIKDSRDKWFSIGHHGFCEYSLSEQQTLNGLSWVRYFKPPLFWGTLTTPIIRRLGYFPQTSKVQLPRDLAAVFTQVLLLSCWAAFT
jgi:hypothetical protein